MLAEVHIHLTFNGKRCCLLLPGLHAPLLPISWFRHTLYFTCSSLLSLQSSRTSDAICKPHRQRLSYTPEPAGKTRDRFKLEPFRSAVRARRGKWKQHFVMREANSRRRLQRPGRTERVKRGQASLGKGHIVSSTRNECGLQAKWVFVFELKSTRLLLPKGMDVSERTECRWWRLIWEGLTGQFLCQQDRKGRRACGISFQAFPDTRNDGEGETKSSYRWETRRELGTKPGIRAGHA